MPVDESSTSTKKTRYQLFKQIMTDAATGSSADYQFHNQFWNTLTLVQLQEVSIYGVRMIAPKQDFTPDPWQDQSDLGADTADVMPAQNAPESGTSDEGGCCHKKSPAPSAKASKAAIHYSGRATASGLIMGIKGERPFDGSHFPRLPFGGKAVSAKDIQFIADWINDGCPEHDYPKAPSNPCGDSGNTHPLSNGEKWHPPMSHSNTYKYHNGELRQRKNAAYLPPEDLEKLRYAIAKVKSFNEFPLDTRSFDSWAKVHGDSCQHGWEQFLPWHRAYLYEFELLLQEFAPGVALPYWDWTLPEFIQGKIPLGGKSGIIPSIYRCFIDQQALDNLKAQGIDADIISALSTFEHQMYNSGTELKWLIRDKLGAQFDEALWEQIVLELNRANPLWHRSRYPGMFYKLDATTQQPLDINDPIGESGVQATFHHHYPRAEDIEQILSINNWRDFAGGPHANQSFGVLSQNPHNTGHIWSGGENPEWVSGKDSSLSLTNPKNGDMFVDLTAFYDPIAWGHHSNVDRLFHAWQERHPGTHYGEDNLSAVMIPWQYTAGQLLDIHKLGYEYVMASHMYPTDSSMHMTRVVTEPTDVHQDVISGHKKAVVRLHQVHRPVLSHYIRVFINDPNADHSTTIENNDHYAGFMGRFGHGDCIGGEGHCDLPPAVKHKYDMRPRHHNTPTNHNVDITETVQKLVQNGATQLQVTLVVLGGSGRPAQDKERARMGAVSINFFD